jgi:hypothetical protein
VRPFPPGRDPAGLLPFFLMTGRGGSGPLSPTRKMLTTAVAITHAKMTPMTVKEITETLIGHHMA